MVDDWRRFLEESFFALLDRKEVSLIENDDKNPVRSKFDLIQINEGSIMKTHVACQKCTSCFSILDKHGHKTGTATLNRHLSLCSDQTIQKNIVEFGKLAYKSSSGLSFLIFL